MWLYRFYLILGVSGYVYSFWVGASITHKRFEESDRLTAELKRKLNISNK